MLSVKSSSEKLLQDLEICWQENILLHGICDIVKTHAEENFSAYVTYCENQILIEGALKNIRYLLQSNSNLSILVCYKSY